MSDPSECPACHAKGTLEYAPEIGTLACTRCGTVSASSASHSFELLQRVDAEDEFQNGRTYVGGHAVYGGVGALAARRSGARVGTWTKTAEGGAGIYQAQRRTEAELYIRRLLTRYDVVALRNRTRHLFDLAKVRLGFRWGRKAEVFAAACVYVAAREAGKPLWLLDMAALIDVKDSIILSRAVRVVKYELKVDFDDHDPAMFIERLVIHLQHVFTPTSSAASSSKSPPLPPLHGFADKRKTTFSAPNAAWIRSLPLSTVRDLATGLLALTSDLALTAGRRAESVACALVIAALEGVARRPAPVVQEFADELAWSLGVAGYTVMERYRDINRLLVDFAAKLPWNMATLGSAEEVDETGGKIDKRRKKKSTDKATGPVRAGRKEVKTEVVAFTADIVALRKTLVATKPVQKLELPATDVDEPFLAEADTSEGDNEYDESDYIDDPLLNESAAGRYYGSRDGTPDSAMPASSYAPSPPHALPDTPSSAPIQPEITRTGLPALPSAILGLGKAGKRKRPAEYTRVGPSKCTHQRRAGALSESAAASPADGPEAGARRNGPAPLAADASVRQLLLAGLDLEQATRQLRGQASTSTATSGAAPGASAEPTSRLGRLLWSKSADEITDAELFDEGELEAYLRPREDAHRLLQLPWAKEMIAVDEAHARARAARPEPGQADRPVGTKARYKYSFSAPRDAHGAFIGSTAVAAAGGARRGTRIKRGGTEDSEDADGFRPRKRQTKITNRAALDAYLARGAGSSDDEAEAETANEGNVRRASEAWKVGMALQAAQDEGEDVADVDVQDEDDDPESDPAEDPAVDGDDWRTQVRGYRAADEEDEDDL